MIDEKKLKHQKSPLAISQLKLGVRGRFLSVLKNTPRPLGRRFLTEAESRVKQFITEGIIRTKEKPEYADFFIKNADDSIDSAKALFELSTKAGSKMVHCLIEFRFHGKEMPARPCAFLKGLQLK